MDIGTIVIKTGPTSKRRALSRIVRRDETDEQLLARARSQTQHRLHNDRPQEPREREAE